MKMLAFDARDMEILAERITARAKISGPRVGDWVQLRDGTVRRFTHHWSDGLQTTYRWRDSGNINNSESFHLCRDGLVSFSGSLDDIVPVAELEETGDTVEGRFWFFHHDEWKAHNGVACFAPCRMYRQT